MRLQDTLAVSQDLFNQQSAEADDKAAAEKRARNAAGEKASRLAMLEAAANDAQAEEARQILKRRAAADARMAEREVESNATRRKEARKKEQQRLLAVRPTAARTACPACSVCPPSPLRAAPRGCRVAPVPPISTRAALFPGAKPSTFSLQEPPALPSADWPSRSCIPPVGQPLLLPMGPVLRCSTT